jgi:hypothetical protein
VKHVGQGRLGGSKRAKTVPPAPADWDETVADALETWRAAMDRPLFVYFVQAVSGGPVKIGGAENPVRRLWELQCGNPERLVVRALLLASVDSEESIQRSWRPVAHIGGEWFGAGYEDAIVALAAHASGEQLRRYRDCRPSLQALGEYGRRALAFPRPGLVADSSAAITPPEPVAHRPDTPPSTQAPVSGVRS